MLFVCLQFSLSPLDSIFLAIKDPELLAEILEAQRLRVHLSVVGMGHSPSLKVCSSSFMWGDRPGLQLQTCYYSCPLAVETDEHSFACWPSSCIILVTATHGHLLHEECSVAWEWIHCEVKWIHEGGYNNREVIKMIAHPEINEYFLR